MPDIECPQCGHRALSVATRCPRCGQEFAPELLRPLPSISGRPWLRPALLVAGGLALVLVISRFGRDEDGTSAVTDAPAVRAMAPAPVRESLTVAGGAPPVVATPPRPAPRPAADPDRRYATTWINVRQSRSSAAPTVRVLRPGEAVLVDSLRGGWYRVVVDGRTLGYAARRFLEVARPAAVP